MEHQKLRRTKTSGDEPISSLPPRKGPVKVNFKPEIRTGSTGSHIRIIEG